jgi:hypothetical protein
MIRKAFAACALLLLAACATPQDYSAAGDIHRFLIAVRDNDRAAFDAHVDRVALRRQVEGRLIDELPKDPIQRGVGLLIAQPVAKMATELLVQPRVFRAVAVYNGYDPAKPIPRAALIAQVVRSAGNGQVCIGDKKSPCTLVFAREGDVWRLIAFQGDLDDLRAS